ncbi:sugar kinase [bacterium]|nr:sugar kinase [bacterium]
MVSEKLDIVALGEGLIELSSEISLSRSETFNKYYGGDSLATAIAAKRLGSKVGYITKLGNDYFKEYLLNSWENEGLNISQVSCSDGYNGLYLLARTNETGKEFSYYRKKTAATKLSVDDIDEEYIKNAKCFYSTGITQSLSLSVREVVKKSFDLAKLNGLITAYDPNFSPLIVSVEEAREFFDDISQNLDILFMNDNNDMVTLFDFESIEKCIKHFWDMGIQTVIIKSTQNRGYYTGYAGDISFSKMLNLNEIVDTTSCGDAFNGGFLHALTSGFTAVKATQLASVVASVQAGGMGAIKSIPYKEEVYSEFEKI